MKLKQMIKIGKDAMVKYSPNILTAAGVVLFGVTVYLAVKKTDPVKKILKEKKKAGASKLETVKAVAPEVIPPAVTGAAAVGCVIASNRIAAERIATIGAVCSMTKTAFEEYKAATKEELGEKKESLLKSKIAKVKSDKNPPNDKEVILTGRGEVLCYDSYSGRYFRSSPDYIRKVINELNKKALAGKYDFISLNQLYIELGLGNVRIGDDFGWRIDRGLIDVDFNAFVSDTDEPCLALEYEIAPKYGYGDLGK